MSHKAFCAEQHRRCQTRLCIISSFVLVILGLGHEEGKDGDIEKWNTVKPICTL